IRTSSARTACWFVAEVDGQPGDQRIRWIDNDGVRWFQAGNNFNSVSVIATDLDRNQLGFAVSNQSDLQSLLAKESAMKGLAREFIEGQSGGRTGTRGTGVHLRNRDVYANGANRGDVKQF